MLFFSRTHTSVENLSLIFPSHAISPSLAHAFSFFSVLPFHLTFLDSAYIFHPSIVFKFSPKTSSHFSIPALSLSPKTSHFSISVFTPSRLTFSFQPTHFLRLLTFSPQPFHFFSIPTRSLLTFPYQLFFFSSAVFIPALSMFMSSRVSTPAFSSSQPSRVSIPTFSRSCPNLLTFSHLIF